MQKYAKLIDGKIEFAPKNKGSIANYNLSVELMTADGYKPFVVVEEPTPEKPIIHYRDTKERIEQYAEAKPIEQKAAEARAERDRRINAIRWRIERYQTQEAAGLETTDTAEQYKEILLYVQALRDVPAQKEFPENVTWPKMFEEQNELTGISGELEQIVASGE